MTFYETFNANKKKYKLNNRVIGELVEMKPDALRMAINNKSLTRLEIAAIEKFFNSMDENYKAPDLNKEFINDLFESEYFKSKLLEFMNNQKNTSEQKVNKNQ